MSQKSSREEIKNGKQRHVTNTAQSLSSAEIACLSRNKSNRAPSENKRTFSQALSFSLISSRKDSPYKKKESDRRRIGRKVVGKEGKEKMNSYKLFSSAISKIRTWECLFLFLVVYATLLFSSIVDWYGEKHKTSSCWPAVFAWAAVFGVLSMAVALFIAVPAFFVIWISVVVLMVLAGKSSRRVVVEGKKVAREIAEIVLKGLLLKGNFVALLCALPAYFVFFNSYSSSSCP